MTLLSNIIGYYLFRLSKVYNHSIKRHCSIIYSLKFRWLSYSDKCFHSLQFAHISALLDNVISTYSGQIERIQDNPSWMTKSYHLFVSLPVHLVVVADLNLSLCTYIPSVCHLLFRLKIQLRDRIMQLERLV